MKESTSLQVLTTHTHSQPYCDSYSENPSNPDTNGAKECVNIREVSLLQGLNRTFLGESKCFSDLVALTV